MAICAIANHGRVIKELELVGEVEQSESGEGIYYATVRDEDEAVFRIVCNRFMHKDADISRFHDGNKFYAALEYYVSKSGDFGVVHLVRKVSQRAYNAYRKAVGLK